MTGMDRIEGWEEEQLVGSRFAACVWICTKAVLCDGQDSTQDYLRRRLSTIMESVGCVCEEAMEGHELVSELTISMQESENLVALSCDIDAPCVVQWRLLWFSSPSRLNRRFADNATIFEKYHEGINFANVAPFTAFWGGFNTPRTSV